jgi:hypothetical protein
MNDPYIENFKRAWPVIQAVNNNLNRHVWNLGYVPSHVTIKDLITGEDSSPKEEGS